MTLGTFLKQKRKKKGLSFREAQDWTGVSHTLIFQIEKGIIKRPGFWVISKLCLAYGISLDGMVKRISQ